MLGTPDYRRSITLLPTLSTLTPLICLHLLMCKEVKKYLTLLFKVIVGATDTTGGGLGKIAGGIRGISIFF